jgi:hypothetical protein
MTGKKGRGKGRKGRAEAERRRQCREDLAVEKILDRWKTPGFKPRKRGERRCGFSW